MTKTPAAVARSRKENVRMISPQDWQEFFAKSYNDQKKIVFRRAKKFGEKKVIGELHELRVLFKKTQPQKSKRALSLTKEVAGSFEGHRQVMFPIGYAKKLETMNFILGDD